MLWLCLQSQMVSPQPGSRETTKRRDQWHFGRGDMKEPPLTSPTLANKQVHKKTEEKKTSFSTEQLDRAGEEDEVS